MSADWEALAGELQPDGIRVGKVRARACKGGVGGRALLARTAAAPARSASFAAARSSRHSIHMRIRAHAAQIDGSRERGLFSRFRIEHFPTIFFINATTARTYEYDGRHATQQVRPPLGF